jgi:hypothetical protein
MHDILWYLFSFMAFASWCLYVFEMLPKIRKQRAIYLRDWGFSAFKPLQNINEYKKICEKENQSLIWYKVQLFLIYSFIVIGLVEIIIL